MNLATSTMFKHISLKDNMIEIKGEKLVAVQSVLLKMMDDIDFVCRKHKIQYFLSGGSMLGAIRHKGFIPWDDDMDIFMTRREFERFKLVVENELKDDYWLQIPECTHNYGAPLHRIMKNGTIFRGHLEDEKAEHCGVFIDIFVLENTYDNKFLRSIHCFLSMFLGLAVSCRRFYDRRKLYLSLTKDDKNQRRSCKIKIVVGFLLSFLSLDTWTKMSSKVFSMCKNDCSKLVVCPSGRKHFTGETYPRDPFCNVIEADFEGRKFFISEWYDSYLKNMYGDYMQIPPESERETHVVLAFDLGDEYKKE